MKKEELEKLQKIRFKEKEVRLCNQHIIELGYMAADLIQPLADTRQKLFFEDANCYSNVFYLVKDLLKQVDPEYLEMHQSVRDFYDQDLSNDWDRLDLSSGSKLDITGPVGMQLV